MSKNTAPIAPVALALFATTLAVVGYHYRDALFPLVSVAEDEAITGQQLYDCAWALRPSQTQANVWQARTKIAQCSYNGVSREFSARNLVTGASVSATPDRAEILPRDGVSALREKGNNALSILWETRDDNSREKWLSRSEALEKAPNLWATGTAALDLAETGPPDLAAAPQYAYGR